MSTDDLREATVGRESEDADGWEMVTKEWWKLSFSSVDWTCRRRYHWTLDGQRLPVHPPPPFYHDFLFNEKEEAPFRCASGDEDVDLNNSLAGVKGVEDAIKRYEVAVGIAHEVDPDLAVFYPNRPLLYSGELDDVDLKEAQYQWDECVVALLGGIFSPCDFTVALDPEYNMNFWDMDLTGGSQNKENRAHSIVSPDITDLTDSDMSLDSDSDPPPSTPYADKKSYAEVLFEDRARMSSHEAAVVSPSPSKPLNASALSFVPAYSLDSHSPPSPTSDLPYVSPTYEYHFPSLGKQNSGSNRVNSQSVPPLQRDEHGFYTEVSSSGSSLQSSTSTRSSTPKRPSGQALQGFLSDATAARSNRSSSKTRELVDRLRSSAPPRRQRKGKGESSLRHSIDAGHSASPEDPSPTLDKDGDDFDVDGWITGLESGETTPDTRQRDEAGWVQGLFQCRPTEESPSTQTPAKAKSSHERSSSTTSTALTPSTPSSASSHLSSLPSPATSVSSLRPPPKPSVTNAPQYPSYPPFYPAPFAVPPYAAYAGSYAVPPIPMVPPQGPTLQMMQMQQAQWRMQMPQPYMMQPPMYAARRA